MHHVSNPVNSRWRSARLVAPIVALALFVAACGSDGEAASAAVDQNESVTTATAVSATATPEPVSTATAEPAPTAAPEATATPEPTVEPAVEPVVEPAEEDPGDPQGCSSLSGPVSTTESLTSGGNEYSYALATPDAYDGITPYPVILNFHGLGSNGAEQQVFSGISNVAGDRYIIVHPTGLSGIGGDDRNSWELPLLDTDARDDIAFVSELIDHLANTLCVDLDRVFSMGMSNGALFTSSLLCNLGERITAGASVAGVTHDPGCNPADATPYLAIHGVEDSVVPYNGGGFSTLSGTDSDEPSPFFEQVMPDEFAEFAADFGCGEPAAEVLTEQVTRFVYPGCADGVELQFVSLADGGHTWPGSAISNSIPSLGFTNMEYDATGEIIAFFDRVALG